MRKPSVIIGNKYNMLTPIEIAYRGKNNLVYYRCKCECGGETILLGYQLSRSTVKSCGCLRGNGKTKTITYSSWRHAKQRCTLSNNEYNRYYKDKGVKMCERWLYSYDNFLADMGERPSKDYSLDRINPDGDYCPENCRWATAIEQNNNRGKYNRIVVYNGKEFTVTQLCRALDINKSSFFYGLRNGWSVDKIVNRFINKKGNHFTE